MKAIGCENKMATYFCVGCYTYIPTFRGSEEKTYVDVQYNSPECHNRRIRKGLNDLVVQ